MVEVESVNILWTGRDASKVEVAGQFSNWQHLTMSRTGEDVWGIRLKLRHGEYHMKFIVDGEWKSSEQLETVIDADGNVNNLLVVEPVSNVDDEEIVVEPVTNAHNEESLTKVDDDEELIAEPVTNVDDEELIVEPVTNVDDEELIVDPLSKIDNEELLVDPVSNVDSLESVDKVTNHLTEITNADEETAEVTLRWTGRAGQVAVAGDFSYWQPLTMSQEETELWKLQLKVKQGSYHLKFLVDGLETTSDHMEKQAGPDSQVFNILNVSVDNQKVSQEPVMVVESSVHSKAEGMQCNALIDDVIGQSKVNTDLDIADLIHDNKCQNLMSGADMNEKEFARAETDNIDDAEIGGNVGVCEKNVHWKGFASDVRVIGDFSNWNPITLSNLNSDNWSLTLKLPQGPHLLKFIVDKKFVLSEQLEKVIGPDQELYNLVQVGDYDSGGHEIKYESDSEPTSMVVIESEQTKDYVFEPFDDAFVETGHWVETGYNNFANLTPDDLSIIYEEDTIGNSHVEFIESNEMVGTNDKETEDASNFDKASTTLTNEKQMLVNDKLGVTASKKYIDDSLSPYYRSPEDQINNADNVEKSKNSTEVVDTCIAWIGFARHVQVIGEFSNWSPLILSNARDDDWQLVLKLPFGSYLMKYIVDGRYVISDDMEKSRGPDGGIYNLLSVTTDHREQEEILRTKGSPVESLTADSLQDSGYDQSFEETKQFSSSSSTNDEYDKESQILGSLTPEIDHDTLVDMPDIPIIRSDSEQLSVFLGCKTNKDDHVGSIPSIPFTRNEEQLAVFLGCVGSDEVTNIPITRPEEDQLSVFDESSATNTLEEEIRELVRQITEDATQELGKENDPDNVGQGQDETKETLEVETVNNELETIEEQSKEETSVNEDKLTSEVGEESNLIANEINSQEEQSSAGEKIQDETLPKKELEDIEDHTPESILHQVECYEPKQESDISVNLEHLVKESGHKQDDEDTKACEEDATESHEEKTDLAEIVDKIPEDIENNSGGTQEGIIVNHEERKTDEKTNTADQEELQVCEEMNTISVRDETEQEIQESLLETKEVEGMEESISFKIEEQDDRHSAVEEEKIYLDLQKAKQEVRNNYDGCSEQKQEQNEASIQSADSEGEETQSEIIDFKNISETVSLNVSDSEENDKPEIVTKETKENVLENIESSLSELPTPKDKCNDIETSNDEIENTSDASEKENTMKNVEKIDTIELQKESFETTKKKEDVNKDEIKEDIYVDTDVEKVKDVSDAEIPERKVDVLKEEILQEVIGTTDIETPVSLERKEQEKEKMQQEIVELVKQDAENENILNVAKENVIDFEDVDRLKEEQAIIDDINIQNFIDKNNQLMHQSNAKELKSIGNEPDIGNVNDAFVNCDEINSEIPTLQVDTKEVTKSNKSTEEKEVVESAINAVEANVAKFEEALKVQEVNENAESGDISNGEAKSKPLMKSICNMCLIM